MSNQKREEKKMLFITVFTPTYNRKELLERLYKSLIMQTDYDFIWLVIDDGSTDNTDEYIKSLQKKENKFKIEYHYKENGGLHTAYNEAIKFLDTELCMCCDSDDWLPDNCIETVKKIWKKNHRADCAGIIGLDFYADNKVIGEKLPKSGYIDLNELYIQGGLVGDKKIVVRSELYQKLPPMITQKGEKNFNPNYLNVKISEEYVWMGVNKNLCYVEYQPEGMTNSIYKQYVNSPNSFIELRKLYIGLKKATLKFKCRHIIHYDAECLLAKRGKDIWGEDSPQRGLSILFFPAGLLLYIYIKKRVK